jgi:hypothetical protein
MVDEEADKTRVEQPSFSHEETPAVAAENTDVVERIPKKDLHHDAVVLESPNTIAGAESTPAVSTAQMAQQSNKVRRRARDAEAERTAMRVLLFVFLGVGGLGLFLINSGMIDVGGPISKTPHGKNVEPRPSPPVLVAPPIAAAQIPALESLEREGLTIVAEGLPEVIAIDPAAPPEILVGIESCRYTFAVWEFSPNKRFRFMTTCELLKGEILAGAWHRDGSRVLMSPLSSAGSELKSVFEVEKPSMMITEIKITAAKARPVYLRVKQRITGIRPGMNGAVYMNAYEPKNTVKVKGIRIVPEAPKPKAAPGSSPKNKPSSGNPLLDLLE